MILSVIVVIAIPAIGNSIENAEEEACYAYGALVERLYESYLTKEQLEHSPLIFNQYVSKADGNMDPGGTSLSYTDGKVQCSLHPIADRPKEKEEKDSGGVLFYNL